VPYLLNALEGIIFLCLYVSIFSRPSGTVVRVAAQGSDDLCVAGSNSAVKRGCQSFDRMRPYKSKSLGEKCRDPCSNFLASF
jgi:hypothetical protein